MKRTHLVWAATAAAVLACESASTGPEPTPRSIAVVSGTGQSATVGATLADSLVVEVLDGESRPMAGIAVSWRTESGGISPGESVTDGSGRARAAWTLGTVAGEQHAVATVSGLSPAQFTATATAGEPTGVEAEQDSIRMTALGDSVRLTASFKDAYGNVVQEAVATWTSLEPEIVAVNSDGWAKALKGGVARAVASWGASAPAAGVRQATTRGAGADTVTLTVEQVVASVALQPDSADVEVGKSVALAATAADANGHPIEGKSSTWSSSDDAVATVDRGVVTGVTEGVATITATVDGESATATIVVRAAAAPAQGFTAARVDAGALHTCALNDAGAAWCWGTNVSGRLASGGNGPDGDESTVPLPVAGGHVFTRLTTGDSHTCGLTADGTAYCWGDNESGRLGNGTTDDTNEQVSEVPTAVAGGLAFAAISAGGAHTCGLTMDGTAYCWGNDNSGELGIGVAENMRITPTAVATELDFTAISAGSGTTCALTAEGKAYCWGYNTDGQVGDGTTEMRLVPTAVVGDLTFTAIAASRWHLSCGLTPEGKLYCWGRDLVTGFNSATPAPVASDLTFTSFSVGFAHTCGVTGDGTAYCWGLNSAGQLGTGSAVQTATVPTPVAGGLTFDSVQGSWSYHTCGLTTDGVVHCWGLNSAGQLGDGTKTNRNAPVPVVRVEGS